MLKKIKRKRGDF